MSRIKGLKCRECHHRYSLEPIYACDLCFGPLEVEYDYELIRTMISPERIAAGPATMWRYRDLLPVESARVIDLHAGFTPLVRAENLGRELGLEELYIKNDCVNPTYSFKDRVVSVAATKALEFGLDTLACSSTGNLASSVAAHAARAGMKACVFIPADVEAGKILGTAIYAPDLIAVDGDYDDVNRLCSEVADRYDWGFVNINLRPFYTEGSKTLAFETAEQLGWRVPDHCVVPIASGALFTKIWQGFHELQSVGLVDRVGVRMSAAQSTGCSPVVSAYEAGTFDVRPVKATGIVKSLAVGDPADGYHVLRIIAESHGSAAQVTDEEVIDGVKLLAQTEGIFAETAGGATIAVLKKLVQRGAITPREVTVAYITGSGLKTQEVMADHVVKPLRVSPNVREFEAAWESRLSFTSPAT
jgi:threonine synthase